MKMHLVLSHIKTLIKLVLLIMNYYELKYELNMNY